MKKTLKIIGGIAIALVVLLVVVMIIVGRATAGLVDTADQFFVDMKNGEVEKAYNSTASQFQNAVPLADFKTFLGQYPILEQVEDSSFSNRSVENSNGRLYGTITAENGDVSPIAIQLIQEREQWRILNLDLNPSMPTDDDW